MYYLKLVLRNALRHKLRTGLTVLGIFVAILAFGLLRTVVESVWFDDIKAGNYDLAVGAIVSTLLDPSDYFNAWYKKDGPQNYGFWDNKTMAELLPQIDREVDVKKRLELIRKVEDAMEQDPPVLPLSWEKINDVWFNYVKGHNPYEYFGIYDCVRFDTFWLDK